MSLLILSSFTVVYVWTTSDSDRLRRTEVICLASQKLAWATEKTISVEAAWKNKGRLHFHLVSKQKTFLVQCNPTLRWQNTTASLQTWFLYRDFSLANVIMWSLTSNQRSSYKSMSKMATYTESCGHESFERSSCKFFNTSSSSFSPKK